MMDEDFFVEQGGTTAVSTQEATINLDGFG